MWGEVSPPRAGRWLGVTNGVLDHPPGGSKNPKKGYFTPWRVVWRWFWPGRRPSQNRNLALAHPVGCSVEHARGWYMTRASPGHVPDPVDKAGESPYMGMYGVPYGVWGQKSVKFGKNRSNLAKIGQIWQKIGQIWQIRLNSAKLGAIHGHGCHTRAWVPYMGAIHGCHTRCRTRWCTRVPYTVLEVL